MKQSTYLATLSVAAVCICLFRTTASAQPSPVTTTTTNNELAGFVIKDVRFDESSGTTKPMPKIPASWRLVGVCNGEKANCNNLWFQDKEGTLYVIQGFSTYGEFTLRPIIGKVNLDKEK